MSLDNLDTGKFVPVQVPRNRFKVLYQYIARPKYHGLRRTRNIFWKLQKFSSAEEKVDSNRANYKALNLNLYCVSNIYPPIEEHAMSNNKRCVEPCLQHFQVKVCVCVCLPENLWSNSPWIKCGWLLSLFSWSEKHFSNGFRHAFQIRSCINLFRENVVFFSLSHPMAELERAKPKNE